VTRKPSATADERRLYLAYRSIEHKQAQADLMVSHPDVVLGARPLVRQERGARRRDAGATGRAAG
jgi:hypothetical protein